MSTVHAVSTPVSGHPLIRVLSSLRSYGNNFLGYLERHFYPLIAVVHSSRPCSNEPVNKRGYLVKKSYMFTLHSHKSSKLNTKDLVNCCVPKVVGLKQDIAFCLYVLHCPGSESQCDWVQFGQLCCLCSGSCHSKKIQSFRLKDSPLSERKLTVFFLKIACKRLYVCLPLKGILYLLSLQRNLFQ